MSMSGARRHHPLGNDLLPPQGHGRRPNWRRLSGEDTRYTPTNTPNPNNMIKALKILLGCLALTATVHAHGGAKGKGGNQAEIPADLLAKYDKDADGKLDVSELAALTSEDRASLGRQRRHHGRPGRGDGDARGDGRGKGGPGGKGAPGVKGDVRGDDAGRGKDNGRGKDDGRGKGKAN